MERMLDREHFDMFHVLLPNYQADLMAANA
jgi:hypothetical protein